ncbi:MULTISPECIES: flippase [unclassified Wenzhouxiangella]|uniref:flippase n=1 Tax=unclassified Wenzhouxiangella TaxID=2613841 RepID=UPI000E32C3C5|nr:MULTISPECIES: flippase [unclassified Wenzhouxiangella]RFF27868.1 flippase [Wenzhouxiangella sp. 15181]RFP69005.1 flippase [Wenzhouxiangella sp. 15190]
MPPKTIPLYSLFHKIFTEPDVNALRGQLTKAGLGSVLIRVGNLTLGLGLAILLARVLGPEQYGIYTFVIALVSMVVIPAQFGLPRLVVRETAKTQVLEKWGLMRGLWRWTAMVGGALSLMFVCIGLGTLWLLAEKIPKTHYLPLFFGVALIPLITFNSLIGAALQGLRKVVLGQAPEQILRPALLILLIPFAIWWMGGGTVEPVIIVILHIAAASLALLIGLLLFNYKRPFQIKTLPAPQYEIRLWSKAMLPLALVAGMQQINKYTDIIMLEYFKSATEVGLYRISVQGALLTSFGLQVIGMFISPYFARLYEQGDLRRLQKLATASARAALIMALPLFTIVIVWGDELIRIMFGEQYVNSYPALAILAGGQLAHSFFGYVGIILNMCGFQKSVAIYVSITAGVNILLNATLIPQLGMEGAAMATTVTLFLFNLLLWREAFRRIGISTTALGLHANN